ncbi:hypothetical protein N510_002103 [Firmicutes bacterium ASF500]|nr:hypothetical protein N510_002103 [Firmicutes bacterium ASF500]
MGGLQEILMTVAANVIAYYICKWLDGHTKGR